MPPQTAAVDPVEKSSLWVTPGSRKCTCASIRPGRMWSPLASIVCPPSGNVSLAPIATILPPAMATPPCSVASGVTIDPFFTTKSAFMTYSSSWSLERVSLERAELIGIEHPLDLVGVRGPRERERKQNAGLPRLEVVAGDETLAFESWAAHHTSRCDPAAQAHEHAALLV